MTRQDRIREIVADRGIEHLLHFTPVSNIPSIAENGIVPLKDLLDSGIKPTITDPLRLDGLPQASCLSISFPQSFMLAKALGKYKAEPHVVIGIHPRVLWEKDCAFCPTNAASGKVDGIEVEELSSADVLEMLFGNLQWQDRHPELPSQYPTDVQAEILVLDHIEPQYFIGSVINRHPKRVYWPWLQSIGWSIEDGPGTFFDEDRMRAIRMGAKEEQSSESNACSTVFS